MNTDENITFKQFCDLCTEISKAERDKKSEILCSFIENWRTTVGELKKKNDHGKYSFYPVLRFLLPQLDRERGAYGVKENTLAKIYIRILCLPKNGSQAKKLLEYRAPKSGGHQACDFAEVAYWILKSRCSKGEELLVSDVNDHLDAIALKHANGDPRGVDSELTSLLKDTSAEEQKWLIRIILKDLKLGLGQHKILNAYHPDARDYYDSCNDLQKICETLTDKNIRLHEIAIQMFTSFRPMLSEECDVSKVDNYLKKSPYFYIESKLDGERFQLHMNQGEYKYFSRNGYEYTSFGRNSNEGLLTPKLSRLIKHDVESMILDGEMMCWDSEYNRFVSKGMNTDVKNLKETSRYKPCFAVFDIVYLNGRVLTNQPLNYRLDVLSEIITTEEGVVTFPDRKKISRKEEVWNALNEAIENREEGIVMKDFLSVYKPNVRKHGGWYKLKPEYTDGLMDALDVLIIGGYYGSGRHKGNVSHFLLGVAVEDENPKTFYSVARVGSGYSVDELFEIQMKLQPHWKKVHHKEMPDCICWTKQKPDVWIEPNKSFILQVKASEIMPSDSFKTGYTLRFPRVEKVRYDKPWTDCLTLSEFEEKRKAASGKLVKRGFESSDTDDNVTPKKKKSPRSNISLPVYFKGADLSCVDRRSDVLLGKEICVLSGCKNFTKNDIEKKIAEYGGSVVQNPGSGTYCALAEEESTVRISNIIKCGSHDVVRTSWFISHLSPSTKDIPQLTPEVLLGMSRKTSEQFLSMYDEYGDQYYEFATLESLRHPFKVIEAKTEKEDLTIDEIYNLDVELFSGESPYGLFRLCCAYFDRFPIIGNPESGCLSQLEIAQIDFKFYGGTCCEYIKEETTHVILSKEDLSRMAEFFKINRERRKKIHIVTEEWIKSSLKEKRVTKEEFYYPQAS